MQSKINLDPIGPGYLRADLGNTLQLHNLIEWVLEQTGKSQIIVVTFSISEEFIRKIWMLKNKNLINNAILILDFKAVQKTKKLTQFYEKVFDEIRYCKIHAKVVMIDSPKYPVCITGSQNATRGNRFESILITTREEIILPLRRKIEEIKTIQL